ncbi:MAG: response regulator transcription factor [Bacilli bacterium]|nr:response regulator transcription factor [Erysipelotrichaceae bacterium]MDD7382203.1 response regulator transcription factor [Bacillales bacterium]MDY2746748.1 response regulator transcription factor [Bacilli bacterium]MDY6141885.1 response regulator transcription factor [Bacilli bacterium]
MSSVIYSVEDDKDIAKIINKTLSKQGYDVVSFYDGTSFIKAFDENKPDMVLLDMMLPDLSGAHLLQYIRKDSANDHIPVVIISANSLVTDKVDGLDMGADDYIAKPFDLLELMSRVNALFRRFKKSSSFEYGKLVLNSESHICKYDGKTISLTIKEFDILALLLKNKGKVVSRDEILSSIWGNEELETRTIDMHIKSLRKKINDEGIIETIYGLGYKVG